MKRKQEAPLSSVTEKRQVVTPYDPTGNVRSLEVVEHGEQEHDGQPEIGQK